MKCNQRKCDRCGEIVRTWMLFVRPGEPRDGIVCVECVVDETVRGMEEFDLDAAESVDP